MNVYGFSLGEMGAMFAFLMAGCLIGSTIYAILLRTVYEPYTLKHGIGVQEYRLVPGIFASVLAPAGLFLFAWTAQPEIHWIVPTIGVVIYVASQFLVSALPCIWLVCQCLTDISRDWLAGRCYFYISCYQLPTFWSESLCREW